MVRVGICVERRILNTFTPNELATLQEKFRLTSQTKTSSLSAQGIQLLNEDHLQMYLTAAKEESAPPV